MKKNLDTKNIKSIIFRNVWIYFIKSYVFSFIRHDWKLSFPEMWYLTQLKLTKNSVNRITKLFSCTNHIFFRVQHSKLKIWGWEVSITAPSFNFYNILWLRDSLYEQEILCPILWQYRSNPKKVRGRLFRFRPPSDAVRKNVTATYGLW